MNLYSKSTNANTSKSENTIVANKLKYETNLFNFVSYPLKMISSSSFAKQIANTYAVAIVDKRVAIGRATM